MFNSIKDRVLGKVPSGTKRSSKWNKLRKEHLKGNPKCAVCGSLKKLEVHHKQPFYLRPDLELDAGNLITLCESKQSGINCHLFIGHLGSFKSFNEQVEIDAQVWSNRLRNRPVK